MVVVLFPLIIGIITCYYTGIPVDLLRPTDVPYTDTIHTFVVSIEDYPVARKKTIRYTASVLARIDSASVIPCSGQVYLYLQPDSTRDMPTYGDTLLVRTHIRRGGMLGDFDYGKYLRLQGIAGQGMVWRNKWQKTGSGPFVPRYSAVYIQHTLVERYRQAGIEGDELGVLTAMTLGYREDIDREIRSSFQRSGAAHILAVSGLHTGILYSIILGLLTLGGYAKPLYVQRTRRRIQSIIIIAVLWGYAYLTGLTPSVVRSVVMISIMEAGRMVYRQSLSLNSVAAAAFLILAIRPTDLFSVSFQLSFAAVTAILVIEPGLSKVVPIYQIRPVGLRKVADYIVKLLSVSLAAQIGTLPLTLYYFGQCSNYFMLTNLIVIPLAWLIVVFGIILSGTCSIPIIGNIVAWLSRHLVRLLNDSVGWIESLPGSVTAMRITLPMAGLLYAAILCSILALRRNLWWMVGTAGSLALFCYLYTIV